MATPAHNHLDHLRLQPGWNDPPTREEIQAALKIFDADGSGELDYEEFVKFAGQMLKNGPDMFFARCGALAHAT